MPSLPYFVVARLLAPLVLVLGGPQNSATPALDFPWETHGCPNPFVENQLYFLFEGTLVSIDDPRTLIVIAKDDHRRIKVHLPGIAIESGPFADEAKGLITNTALGKPVEVSANWNHNDPKPLEITGSADSRGFGDIALSLIKRGLVRTQQPSSYTLSNYTFCQYQQAEKEAAFKRVGLWQHKP